MMQHLILICRLCSRQLMGIFRLARKLSQVLIYPGRKKNSRQHIFYIQAGISYRKRATYHF
ncbi:hypothetical protein SORBI_3004G156250 [Sorghum bicolor]|uniref:Uncharacterized protein n=1 Tax=Sorghum bicolor TaxID=4558 RepID=A0A1Z5RNQ7_SORBI|nr:hypothetical protein SORBI_3004G156250 [Sorghum bicolor]